MKLPGQSEERYKQEIFRGILQKVLTSIQAQIEHKTLQLSFTVPSLSEDNPTEGTIAITSEQQGQNVLIFSSAVAKCFMCSEYRIFFVPLGFNDQIAKKLSDEKNIERNHILRYMIQSQWNLALIFFVEDDRYNVEIANMINVLRDKMSSKIPIYFYFLCDAINDMFYIKLLMKRCNCITPFIKVSYGKYAPAFMGGSPPASQEASSFFSGPSTRGVTYTRTQGKTGLLPGKSINSAGSNFLDVDLNPGSAWQEEEFGLDLIPDFDFHNNLHTICQIFQTILCNIRPYTGDLSLEVIIKNITEIMEAEIKQTRTSAYSAVFKIIKPLLAKFHWELQSSNVVYFSEDPLDRTVCRESFRLYHILMRMIISLMLTLESYMNRDNRAKIAQIILSAIKTNMGATFVKVKISGEWQKMDGMELFQYFRKRRLL